MGRCSQRFACQFRVWARPTGDELDFAWRDSFRLWVCRCLRAGAYRPAGSLAARPARAAEWSERLKTLRVLLPPPEIADGVDRDQIVLWRSTSAALAAFDEIVDEAALALTDPAGVRWRSSGSRWRRAGAGAAARARARRNVVP
jgi:hypothetical protein